jgi:MFS transporter, PPP family, 3-phenylpropionic acid transporter
MFRGRGFALFLAATAAVQASHAVYYGFATLHWQAAGYGDTLIGGLWALGVIAEILLFAAGDRVVRRAGAAWLIVIGGLAGGLRWTVTGTTTELWALVIVQTLHALSFGAVHLGAIHFIARAVPPELSATAQSLYSSVVMGLGLGLMLFAAGPLYAAVGAHAFHAMALSAVLGAGLALRLRRSLPDAAGDGPSAEG